MTSGHSESTHFSSDGPCAETQKPVSYEPTRYPWKLALPNFPVLAANGASKEQFRCLCSNLRQARAEGEFKAVLISSGLAGEGKSYVAANLALNLGQKPGSRVLLIDADFHRSTLHNLFGAPKTPGLSEYLTGQAAVGQILQRAAEIEVAGTALGGGVGALTLIPAGDSWGKMPLTNHSLDALVEELYEQYDWIVVDSPPVLLVADALDFASAVDGVLLVARAGVTPLTAAQKAKETFIKGTRARIFGYVMNAVPKASSRTPYYYY